MSLLLFFFFITQLLQILFPDLTDFCLVSHRLWADFFDLCILSYLQTSHEILKIKWYTAKNKKHYS